MPDDARRQAVMEALLDMTANRFLGFAAAFPGHGEVDGPVRDLLLRAGGCGCQTLRELFFSVGPFDPRAPFARLASDALWDFIDTHLAEAAEKLGLRAEVAAKANGDL